jgi:1-acyl-sn-glycerol-3-phosphate acyltransferase
MIHHQEKQGVQSMGNVPGGRLAYSTYCWLLFCVIIFVFGLLIVIWPGTRARRRRIARCGARLLFRFAGLPLRTEGMERLPGGTHILIANHASFLDALILTAALPAAPGYAFVARQEFRSQVLLWPLLRAVGTIILQPHSSHAGPANIERLAAAVRDGENLVIFPEGGITRAPGLRPFHSGAFVVASRSGIPVVPSGIRGARRALPLKTWKPFRTPITVVVGDALHPCGNDEGELNELAELTRETIALLAGEEIVPAPGCEA